VTVSVGKAAAIAGPYIFGSLKRDRQRDVVADLVAIVMAASGLVAALFGPETRGEALT
jgi:hypothetical protein